MALILGIESSCDETAAALVTSDGRVLAHRLAGQEEAHRPFGGVVPELAARAHVEMAVPLVEAALADVGETPTQRRHAMASLFGMRRSLTGIATNVNQLAAHANATQRFPVEADRVLPEIRKAVARIDALIDEFGVS